MFCISFKLYVKISKFHFISCLFSLLMIYKTSNMQDKLFNFWEDYTILRFFLDFCKVNYITCGDIYGFGICN